MPINHPHWNPLSSAPTAVPDSVKSAAGNSALWLGFVWAWNGMTKLGEKRKYIWHSPCLTRRNVGYIADDDYGTLRERMDELVLFPEAQFKRPPPKDNEASQLGKFVHDDPAERLVNEAEDKIRHLDKALKVKPPTRLSKNDFELADSTVCAIEKMLELHTDGTLTEWRAQRITSFKELARDNGMRELNRKLELACPRPPHVVELDRARKVNVALLLLLVDSLQWPDTDLPWGFLEGFPIMGIIADSGVHRQIPLRQDALSFNSHLEEVMRSNGTWATEVAALVEERGELAAASASKAATPAGETQEEKRHRSLKLNAQKEAWESTMKEVAGGFMGKPMTLAQLLKDPSYINSDGSLKARVMVRYGIYQGEKQKRDKHGKKLVRPDGTPDMVPKLRCIDDARASLSNSCQLTCETIGTCAFDFVAHVADSMVRICKKRGWPVPAMVLGTDDMKAAYRQVPSKQVEHTIVCLYKHEGRRRGAYFLPVYGMNFGHVSAVIGYNRLPELLVHAATRIFACPCNHYVDDYCSPDIAGAGEAAGDGAGKQGSSRSTAQDALAVLHREVGIILEPEKHKPGRSSATFLGVVSDVSAVNSSNPDEREVVFTPTEGRVERILALIRGCRARMRLKRQEAARILGKIQFLTGHSFARVGRAACQPLLERLGKGPRRLPKGVERIADDGISFTTAMCHMHDFFEKVFEKGALQPLRVPVGGPQRKPLLVYTDAQYNHTKGRAGLGVVIVDTESPESEFYFAGSLTSPAILAWLEQRKQQVNQLELLAVLCALMTFPEMFEGRSALFFVDNTAALSACVHGYTHATDMAILANAVHLQLASLRCHSMFMHVPGEANPSDLPSRADWVAGPYGLPILNVSQIKSKDKDSARALNDRAKYVDLVQPTVSQLKSLSSFL